MSCVLKRRSWFLRWSMSRVQRHCIRVVPVTEVASSWKSKEFTFFVYGLDCLVYTADYPQTCCWGCNIL